MRLPSWTTTLLLGSLGLSLYAEEPADKSQYTLFNPTPRQQMREWFTDQPGVSPYTIDAGHFEAELYALEYGFRGRDFNLPGPLPVPGVPGGPIHVQETVNTWAYGHMVLKVGLLNRLDFEVGLTPYITTTGVLKEGPVPETIFGPSGSQTVWVAQREMRETFSGFGDTTARLKYNLWGDDGGPTALALSGVVKFPTADDFLGNEQFEGGPALEFATRLPWEFQLRIDSAANFYESSRHTREVGFENLISLSHSIVGRLWGYCTFDTAVFTRTGANWNANVAVGLNYRLCPNAELFAGNSFGLNGSAYDYEPFVGINVRY